MWSQTICIRDCCVLCTRKILSPSLSIFTYDCTLYEVIHAHSHSIYSLSWCIENLARNVASNSNRSFRKMLGAGYDERFSMFVRPYCEATVEPPISMQTCGHLAVGWDNNFACWTEDIKNYLDLMQVSVEDSWNVLAVQRRSRRVRFRMGKSLVL